MEQFACHTKLRMPAQKLNTEILTAAIDGFEAQKTRIDAQIAALRALLDGRGAVPVTTAQPLTPKRRKMSAAARKRIGDAQRKRWAESKGQAESPSAPATREAPKPKRKLSAAGRKRIIEATKRRWAAIKSARQA
jgi:hypothetical protein